MEKWIEDLIGVPYVEYGNTPESGFHCSGLCRYVLNHRYGIDLPTDPMLWRKMFTYLSWPGPLQDYDIVLMQGPLESHIGIVIDTCNILHSWKPAGGVNLMRLDRVIHAIESAGRLKR